MRWLVGVDTRQSSAGAASLARWCAARAPADSFVGVHVLEQAATALAAELVPPVHDAALHHMAEAALDPLRAESTFSEIVVVEDRSVEDGLERAADEHGCDAIMLGRRKPSSEDAVLRLGRVARRMIRRLPRPVVIVPPDLRGRMIPGGPVLLGTDLGHASEGAASLARRLAWALDLDILVSHVLRVADSIEALLPADAWDERVRGVEDRCGTDLDTWSAAHGLEDARRSIVRGSPTSRLLEVASVAGASMVVVGSRGLSTVGRIFQSSVGGELAASAPIPVAIVPPDWRPA